MLPSGEVSNATFPKLIPAMKTIIEPFKIKSVEPIYFTTREERVRILSAAHFNPFLIHARDVIIDLLTDSGTSAMIGRSFGPGA